MDDYRLQQNDDNKAKHGLGIIALKLRSASPCAITLTALPQNEYIIALESMWSPILIT